MNYLIVANGRIRAKDYYKELLTTIDKIIAADGGADNCILLDITPDYVIGDFDSISQEAQQKFNEKLQHVDDQNSTDLMKALNLAEKLKATHITIIGAIGTRLDHTLANVLCLEQYNTPIKILDEYNDIYVVKDSLTLQGKEGDIVSVFALSDVQGLTYDNLFWKVEHEDVSAGWIGSSNKMTSDTCTISVQQGTIIVMKTRD